MANQPTIRIIAWATSDGSSTTFAIKLAKDGDPYWIGAAQETSLGGRITNWFADNPVATAPKAVRVVSGAVSAGLAVPTSTLTITVTPKPKDEIHKAIIDLLF